MYTFTRCHLRRWTCCAYLGSTCLSFWMTEWAGFHVTCRCCQFLLRGEHKFVPLWCWLATRHIRAADCSVHVHCRRLDTGCVDALQNKMKSDTADLAPGTAASGELQQTAWSNVLPTCAATWRTRRNIFVVFDSGPFSPLSENMTSYTKQEIT